MFFCALDDMKDGITSHKQAELYKALKRIPMQAAIGSTEIGSLRTNSGLYVRRVKKKYRGNRKTVQADQQDGR